MTNLIDITNATDAELCDMLGVEQEPPAAQLVLKHPFGHLGPAPYRFVDVWSLPSKGLLEANPDAYNNALATAPKVNGGLGTCSCCGMPIMNIYIIQCGDKTRWGVGCECVFKCDQEPRLVAAVTKAKRDADRKARHRREQNKLEMAEAWVTENRDRLAALPHPLAHRAARGETLLDSINWYWSYAGTSGKIKCFKNAQSALAKAA